MMTVNEANRVLAEADLLADGAEVTAAIEWLAAEVLLTVLVDKRHNRKVQPDCRADFTGIETEDRFLFGYGLDYRGFWRNAPGIYAVKGL